jgi:hypothetical protein
MITGDQAYYRIVSVGEDPPYPPSEVENLTITILGQSVRLDWTCDSQEPCFNIYRSLEPGFPEGQVELVQTSYPLSWWIDHGALLFPQYFYRITCVRDEAGLIK